MPVVGEGQTAIAALAAVQNGLIHRCQLLAAGFSRSQIERLVRTGWLHPILPRVYAVGHPALAPLGREMAALLNLERDAVLSHRSAAVLWGIIPPSDDAVEVTVLGRDSRRRDGLVTYRAADIDGRDVRLRDRLPVTAPARTVVDLAATAPLDILDRALTEARVHGLVTNAELTAALDRCPGRTGTARLRALMRSERGPALTRSEAERRVRILVDRAQLPRPRFNVMLHGYLVDAVWDDFRLVLEADGYGVHGHRRSFEIDRRRDQVLAADGYIVIRVTWRQLAQEPMAVMARLAQALALRRSGPA